MFLELFSIALIIPLSSLKLDNNLPAHKFIVFFKDNLNLDLHFLAENSKNFILFFFVIFFTKSLLVIFCNWHKIGFTYKIRKYLTNNIYKKYLSLPYENFIKENSAKYLKNINYEINIVSVGLIQLLEFSLEVIIILGLSLFLLFYDFKISIIIFFLSIIFIFSSSFYQKKII